MSGRDAGASLAALGPGQLRGGRDGDRLDDVVPRHVLTPRNLEQIRAVVDDARANRNAIVPSGGGTRRWLGNVPRAYDSRVVTTALGRVVEHSPADLVVTLEAGVTLERANRALAGAGQRLAIDAAVATSQHAT